MELLSGSSSRNGGSSSRLAGSDHEWQAGQKCCFEEHEDEDAQDVAQELRRVVKYTVPVLYLRESLTKLSRGLEDTFWPL